MNSVVCDNVSFAFDRTPVLKNISFELEEGAYLSVIGPNGSAKSTLLKCILALHETGRTSGVITVKGLDVAQCNRRQLAKMATYIPQTKGIIPPFTVREFVALSRYPYTRIQSVLTREDNESIERAFALTDTSCFEKKYLSELSGGERQRVYLASALAQGVDMLFLDEPTSSLDPHNAARVNALLRRLNREEGYTIVIATHDLNHPLDAGGYVLSLRYGEEIYFGSSQGLINSDVLFRTFSHRFSILFHPKSGYPVIISDRESQ